MVLLSPIAVSLEFGLLLDSALVPLCYQFAVSKICLTHIENIFCASEFDLPNRRRRRRRRRHLSDVSNRRRPGILTLGNQVLLLSAAANCVNNIYGTTSTTYKVSQGIIYEVVRVTIIYVGHTN